MSLQRDLNYLAGGDHTAGVEDKIMSQILSLNPVDLKSDPGESLRFGDYMEAELVFWNDEDLGASMAVDSESGWLDDGGPLKDSRELLGHLKNHCKEYPDCDLNKGMKELARGNNYRP